MSATPRTDSNCFAIVSNDPQSTVVWADFARQLETENADISHAYGVTRDVVKGLCEELANLKAENAALRSLLREAITAHVHEYDIFETEPDFIERVKAALGEGKP